MLRTGHPATHSAFARVRREEAAVDAGTVLPYAAQGGDP